MCVICIKQAGVLYPTVDTVKTMCKANPDGFSMVVSNRKRKPLIFKTMSFDKFIALYEQVSRSNDYRTTSLFIHARIKTHGTPRLENCHGWRSDGLVFAHNGVLSIANRDDMTDSETFFRDIFIPAYKMGGWKMAERTIDAVIGTSKFVFMDKEGEIRYYGNYIEDGGLLYSNNSYIPWNMRYPKKWQPKQTWGDFDFDYWLEERK